MNNLTIGDVIPVGTLVLITGGSYSSYGVTGLFRATTDVTVPGRKRQYHPSDEVDTSLLSTLLEEVAYVEAWSDD